jgi:chemosensory pili system protein ChpA (sensor histidine kinase/response regulator)
MAARHIEARIVTVAGERYLLCAADIDAICDATADAQDAGVNASKVARLSDLIDAPGAANRAGGTLVKVRETDWSLLVEDVSEARQFTVQPLPRLLRSVSPARSAAQLPDGGLALLLDSATLLQHAAAVELAAPSSMAEDTTTHGERRVALIVDDAVSVRRRLGRALQALGFECVQARDGVEALAVLDERHVDLLITDRDMPRRDGAQHVQAARQRAGGTPPIVVLAPRHEQARLTASGVTAEHHLLKPFRDGDVAQLLQRLELPVTTDASR